MAGFRYSHLVFVGLAAIGGMYYLLHGGNEEMSSYEKELQEFRQRREERLRSPEGWLSVVGLHWLNEGRNTIGGGAGSNIRLPEGTPENVGEFTLKGRKAKLKLHSSTEILIDGVAALADKIYDFRSDLTGEPTKASVGSVHFLLLDRPNGMGIRVKDENSQARKTFKGNKWYPAKPEFVIEAEWVAEPTELEVPDILGNQTKEKSPGYAKFTVNGVEQKLYPTQDGEVLFFVFRDATSGGETYGAARFLYTSLPVNGKVTLDFNRAINPPCAFTRYATCPLPPAQNILNVAINAGELKPDGH